MVRTWVMIAYIDYQLGRSVTSWGEATFLPIGMNGFVTNAVDITKLASARCINSRRVTNSNRANNFKHTTWSG